MPGEINPGLSPNNVNTIAHSGGTKDVKPSGETS